MQPERMREPLIVKASEDLIGQKVINSQGEKLGEIKELMIDATTGHVTYAILSFGGFLGLADKLFAVPWISLGYDWDRHSFLLKADRELLKNAPGFAKDDWPDMSDATWRSGINKHYGVS